MKSNLIRLALIPATLLACAAAVQAAEVTVSAPESPMLRLAVGKLDAALRQQGHVLKGTAPSARDPDPVIIELAATLERDSATAMRVERSLLLGIAHTGGGTGHRGCQGAADSRRAFDPVNRFAMGT
jgi:hypothetical protein